MSMMRVLAGGVALAALFAGSAAEAKVTADEVWQNWNSVAESAGQTVTVGNRSEADGTLTLRDIAFAKKNAGSEVSGKLPELVLKELPDGTVQVTMGPTYTVNVHSPITGFDETMTLTQKGTKLIASGSVSDMTYRFTGDSVSARMDMPGEGGAPTLKVEIAMGGLAGTYIVKDGDTRSVASDMTAKTAALSLSGEAVGETADETAKKGPASLSATAQDVALRYSATLPKGVDMSDLGAAVKAGMTIAMSAKAGATSFSFDGEESGRKIHGEGGATGGTLGFSAGASKLAYDSGVQGLTLALSGGKLPLPKVSMTLGDFVLNFAVPVLKSDKPQDFSVLLKLGGLGLDEGVWAMIDPNKVLPHDPASLGLDLTGTARLTRDLFADAGARMPGPSPMQADTININSATLSAAGADFSADGKVSLDYTDLTPKGMPRASGAVDASLTGGFGLLDKLVKMGLLPQDKAMQAKLMLGMFSVPGKTPDSLTSKVEFSADGKIMVNGQRLQ